MFWVKVGFINQCGVLWYTFIFFFLLACIFCNFFCIFCIIIFIFGLFVTCVFNYLWFLCFRHLLPLPCLPTSSLFPVFFGTLVSISVFQFVLVMVLLQLLWEVPEQNDSVSSSYLSCPSLLTSTSHIVLYHCKHVLALSNDVYLFEHLHFLIEDTLKKEDFQEYFLMQTLAKCQCSSNHCRH